MKTHVSADTRTTRPSVMPVFCTTESIVIRSVVRVGAP
jgi:hypothetical protein